MTNIKDTSAKILSYVQECGGTASAWQIKMKFRLSSSVLYLSIGALIGQDKVSVVEDGLDHKITLL